MTESNIECAVCGVNGPPSTSCAMCHGKAATRERQYTLSEVRSGKAPKDNRYGDTGAVGPKIVNLPGSGGQGGS